LGTGVWNLGVWGKDAGFRDQVLWFAVQSLELMVYAVWSVIESFVFLLQYSVFRVEGSGFR